MIANVNEALWIDFNLDTAVFLDTIAYWVKKNSGNKKHETHYHEGRYWTYSTQEAFGLMFSGWSRETIRRVIRNCVSNGLLLKGNFNRKGYDRTSWYTLTDKALEYYPKLKKIFADNSVKTDSDSCVGSNQACVRSNPPIPTLLPTSSNNTITTGSTSSPKPSKKNSEVVLREMIDAYRETFPDNPQPHPAAISSSLEKTMRTLIKKWPELDEQRKPFSISSFRRYLDLLKSNAPGFSLREYETPSGRLKKNDLQTFCRWNTIVKFLEGAYS